jgi:plastocyanin
MTPGILEASATASRLRLTSNAIDIGDGAFEPSTSVVTVGTTVTWMNRDAAPHFILSANGKFVGSNVLEEHQRYSVTFERPGEYPYFCALSPKMAGKIVVRDHAVLR